MKTDMPKRKRIIALGWENFLIENDNNLKEDAKKFLDELAKHDYEILIISKAVDKKNIEATLTDNNFPLRHFEIYARDGVKENALNDFTWDGYVKKCPDSQDKTEVVERVNAKTHTKADVLELARSRRNSNLPDGDCVLQKSDFIFIDENRDANVTPVKQRDYDTINIPSNSPINYEDILFCINAFNVSVLINNLKKEADRIEGGYLYATVTFGIFNRVNNCTRKARELRALAEAIATKNSELKKTDPNAEMDMLELLDHEFLPSELNRKNTILWGASRKPLTLREVLQEHRHYILDWFLPAGQTSREKNIQNPKMVM